MSRPRSASRRKPSIENSLEGQRGSLRSHRGSLEGKVGFRDRLHHLTWAWFAASMSTGGIALVLAQTPHRFKGLNILGEIVFIFDIVLFLGICAGIMARFIMFPRAFWSSLTHPTESLFFPTFWIAVANIISNMQTYGVPRAGPWLIVAVRVCFWIYVGCTFLVAVGQYLFLFTGKSFTLQSMTPAWILPVFPVMLTGTLASTLGPSQPPEYGLPLLIAGITFQGLGLLIATFFYSIFLGRLMTEGLPEPNKRPGMFIAIGPPSFTALSLIGISKSLYSIYPSYSTVSLIEHPELIPDIFRLIAVAAALFLWSTAFWFFCIAVVSVTYGATTGKGMSFHLVWWALIFPNVGFTIATISIGNALESAGVLWVGSIMTILLVGFWLFVGMAHIRAVWKKSILWPGKDEDHDQ